MFDVWSLDKLLALAASGVLNSGSFIFFEPRSANLIERIIFKE